MIDHFTLKFGKSKKDPPLHIRPGNMSVLVGPNNSGKSLALREIQEFILNAKDRSEFPNWDTHFKVVGSISPQLPREGSMRSSILEEVGKDILPFRSALDAVHLSPRDILEKFDLSHLGPIWDHLQRFGQLQQLARENKLDPSLVDFDLIKAKEQSTLFQGIKALLQEAIRFIEKNELRLLQVSAKASTEEADKLITGGAIMMDGYLHHFAESTVLLDGKTRLALTDANDTHSLNEPAQSVIMRLFHNDSEREELRKYVLDAFQRHLSIDLTALNKGRFVLSDEPPGAHERAFGTAEAQRYFRGADDIASLSDGLKSYVGLHATLLSQDYRIILLDEPEAFLHPPLARRLGFNLTKLAAKRQATIIAATHSPFFLMGCLEAGPTTSVVRLGYQDKNATARHLSADALHRIMNDPLLRSSRVLTALFHRSAVVCEGDSDQAFYDEINERLRREYEDGNASERYLRDCLFINSHGKDSIERLVGMLRTMGIPAAGIVDLDILQDSGSSAARLLSQAGAGDAVATTAGQLRSKVRDYFTACAKAQLEAENKPAESDQVKKRAEKLIKRGGIDNLRKDGEKRDLEEFLALLKRHGIFVPPRGEVETWLAELGAYNAEKKRWLEEIFKAMGSFEDPSTYCRPQKGDVWDFMRDIVDWVDKHATDVVEPIP